MSVILNKFCNDTSIKAGAIVKYEFAPKGLYHEEEGFAIFCDGLQTRLFFTVDSVNLMETQDEKGYGEFIDLTYKYLIEDGFLNKEN